MVDSKVILDYIREKQEEAFIAYEEAEQKLSMSGHGWPGNHDIIRTRAIYQHLVDLEEELLNDISDHQASG